MRPLYVLLITSSGNEPLHLCRNQRLAHTRATGGVHFTLGGNIWTQRNDRRTTQNQFKGGP